MTPKRWLMCGALVVLFAVAAFGGYELAPQAVNAAQHLDLPAAPAPAATPSAKATPSTPTIKSSQAWLGVLISSITGGARVEQVFQGSPAASSGLQRGDVVTAVDGNAVADAQQLTDRISALKPNDQTTLTIQRNGATQSVTVTLGTRPPKQRVGPHGGLKVAPLNTLGGLGGLVPELSDIPLGEQFDHFRGGSFSYTDKNGNAITVSIVAGSVTGVTSETVSLRPNGANADTTYRIGDDTRVLPGGAAHVVDTLKVEDKVFVVSRSDAQDAIAILDQTAIGAHRGIPEKGAKPQGEGRFRAPQSPKGSFAQGLDDLRQRLQDLQRRLAPSPQPDA